MFGNGLKCLNTVGCQQRLPGHRNLEEFLMECLGLRTSGEVSI